MKNLLFWIILIVGTVALLGSCAKKEESTAAAVVPAGGTGTTPSGTVEGNSDLTGTFHTSHNGEEPVGGCVDNSTSLSNHSYPSETKSHTKKLIITGTSTFTVSQVGYSDAACSTMTSYFNTMYKSVTVGSELTSLTVGSSPAKPTAANKISHVAYKYALMANTTATVAAHLSNYEMSVDSGVELLVDEESLSTKYGLIATATVSGSSYLYLYKGATADNVTDWPQYGTDIWWK